MHAQEVAQEVLSPQEHASGKKKLNCAFNARSSKRKEFKILSTRRRKKLRVLPQTANNQEVYSSWLNQQYINVDLHVEPCLWQTRTTNVILISLLFLRKRKEKHLTSL